MRPYLTMANAATALIAVGVGLGAKDIGGGLLVLGLILGARSLVNFIDWTDF